MQILINRKNISKFLDHYDMGRLLEYEKIKFGFANKIIKIKTTKGSFILKIAVRNNPYKVKYEVDLLNFIKNLPVPKPIKAKNRKYLLQYGSNKAFIYKFIPGQAIHEFDNLALKDIGRFLARYHLQALNFRSSIKRFELYVWEALLHKSACGFVI